jgi:hypothetical protein
MDIKEPQRYLGEVDVQALSEAILAQEPQAWTEQLLRQQAFEVHRDTESIVLLFCDESWPEGEIHREPGWDRLSEVAMPLMDHIINNYYEPGGIVLRAMAAKLKARGRITPHVDRARSFHLGHRIHVPITTSAGVRFIIEGRPYKFEVGKAYELNNQKTHSVMNMSKEDRITFIFDYVPPVASDAGGDQQIAE